jgi:hypothetical protein
VVHDGGERSAKEYELRSHDYPVNVKELQHKRDNKHIGRSHKVDNVLLNLLFLISHTNFFRLEVVFKVVCNLVNYNEKPPHLVPKELPLALSLELQFELHDLPFSLNRLIS